MVNWTDSNDIVAMIAALPEAKFQLELRLFCIACAARALRFLPEPVFANALTHAERHAAGNCSETERYDYAQAASDLLNPNVDVPTVRDLAGSAVVEACSSRPTIAQLYSIVSCAAQAIACATGESVPDLQYDEAYSAALEAETRAQCELLRSSIPWPGV